MKMILNIGLGTIFLPLWTLNNLTYILPWPSFPSFSIWCVLPLTKKCLTALGLRIPPPPLHLLPPPSPSELATSIIFLWCWMATASGTLWNERRYEIVKCFYQSSANMSRSRRTTPLLFQCCDGNTAGSEETTTFKGACEIVFQPCGDPELESIYDIR